MKTARTVLLVQRLLVFAWLVLVLASAHRAAMADTPALWIDIHRESGAQLCPDAAGLWRTMDALFPDHRIRRAGSSGEAGLRVAVTIAPRGGGYEGTLRVAHERGFERSIADSDARCGGLGEALALAVVLLLEPEARPRTVAATPVVERDRPAPSSAPLPFAVAAGLGALGGAGWLGEIDYLSGGACLSVTADFGGPAVRARGVQMWSPRADFREGSIDVDLWAALLGPCWRLPLSETWSLSPCAAFGLGSQRGAAHGFFRNASRSRPFRVLTAELGVARRVAGPLWAVLDAGALLRLHEQTFLVDGEPAHEQAPVGFFVGAGAAVVWEILRAQ